MIYIPRFSASFAPFIQALILSKNLFMLSITPSMLKKSTAPLKLPNKSLIRSRKLAIIPFTLSRLRNAVTHLLIPSYIAFNTFAILSYAESNPNIVWTSIQSLNAIMYSAIFAATPNKSVPNKLRTALRILRPPITDLEAIDPPIFIPANTPSITVLKLLAVFSLIVMDSVNS